MNISKAKSAFVEFVERPDFPCLAGKGLVHSGGYDLHVYSDMGNTWNVGALAADLDAFVSSMKENEGGLRAFVAVFSGRAPRTERAFERWLWQTLQQLHDIDRAPRGDPTVTSDDPEDPHFAFSFAGCAFFVIGLHPRSSRLARRFARRALVFNPHAQFDGLRADGRFEILRAAIRKRDVALQGSLNPNLADFGDRSEARQYSGRATEDDWRCPFHRKDS